MIEVQDLHKHFGGFHAVDGSSLRIETGSITGLIGPNGAGKTTLFNVIAGVLKPTSGKVLMDGEDITGLPPHTLFSKGLLRTFQIAHEFTSMTVRENLMMVPAGQSGERLWNTWFGRKRIAEEERALAAKADEVLEFLTIDHLTHERAGNLSGGQKKLLELGRTMMVDAKIVFLDEVGAGVNRTLLNTIGDAIIRLNEERGYTFCVIEHDMDFIGRLCDPVICMAEGRVLAEGTLDEIIGPNGAGKSTAMKAVFGMLNVRQGAVRLFGEDITALTPQARVAKGMAFVPQTSNIFTSMTVEENLEMGAFLRRDDIQKTIEQVYELFPILREKRAQAAGELSGGQRQQVAVGRALMTQPKVLMLDEPTAGVSPIVMDELFDRIIEVARTGISILMVEQNARQALEIADKGYVLVQGRNRFTDTGAALLKDPEVRKSFLGG